MKRNIIFRFVVSLIAVLGIELLFGRGKVSKENVAIAFGGALLIWIAITWIANLISRQAKR